MWYCISRTMYSLKFVKISYILTDENDVKPVGNLRISYYAYGARGSIGLILSIFSFTTYYYQKEQYLTFIRKPHRLTDIYFTKSNGSLKILILDIWGLGEVFTRFYQFVTYGHSSYQENTLFEFHADISQIVRYFQHKANLRHYVLVFGVWGIEKFEFDLESIELEL